MSTVLRTKSAIIVPCAVVLAAATAACGNAAGGSDPLPTVFTPSPGVSYSFFPDPRALVVSSPKPPTDTQGVRGHLKAHPAPALPGMTAGIRSFNDDSPFKDIRCGGDGGHGSAVTVGSPDDCLAWQVTPRHRRRRLRRSPAGTLPPTSCARRPPTLTAAPPSRCRTPATTSTRPATARSPPRTTCGSSSGTPSRERHRDNRRRERRPASLGRRPARRAVRLVPREHPT